MGCIGPVPTNDGTLQSVGVAFKKNASLLFTATQAKLNKEISVASQTVLTTLGRQWENKPKLTFNYIVRKLA